jgi:hypothetical protein
MKWLSFLVALLALPATALASAPEAADLTGMLYGYLGIFLFVAAYRLVPFENVHHFDIMKNIARAEWNTLMFFLRRDSMRGRALGHCGQHPGEFAVLTMNPEMSHGQWLLVTLTAGVM